MVDLRVALSDALRAVLMDGLTEVPMAGHLVWMRVGQKVGLMARSMAVRKDVWWVETMDSQMVAL